MYIKKISLSFVAAFLLMISCGQLDEHPVAESRSRLEKKNTPMPQQQSDDIEESKNQEKKDEEQKFPLPDVTPQPSPPELPSPKNIIDDGLALITKDQLAKEITFLSSDTFEGRGTGERGNEKAGEWIVEQLKSYGIQPAQQKGYFQEFTANGRKARNIIGLLKGSDPQFSDEYIVIGAHMDHLGIRDCAGSSRDQICNGADDNASGSTGVLNIARALSTMKPLVKRSVLFIWFSGEELGLLGSYFFVNNAIISLDKISYMINMDMIGYAKSFGGVALLGSGTSKTAEALLKNIQKKYPSIKFQMTDRAGGGSDHVPFMAKGIPGVFFNTGVSNNPHYHRPTDTVEQPGFDPDGMTAIVKIAYEHLARIASDAAIHTNSVLTSAFGRAPLVTNEEMQQTCHDLILNPYLGQKK